MIINNVVYGLPAHKVPGHLSYGEYVLEKLKEIVREDGNKISLVNTDTSEEVTYRQLVQDIVSFSEGLRRIGVKRGVVVAICSENRIEYIVAVVAAIFCGAIVTTVNVHYADEEMLHVFNISQPAYLICSEAAVKTKYHVFKTLRNLKTIIQMNGKITEKNVNAFKEVMVFKDIFEFEPTDVNGATDTMFILYSSGTTGLPKGVMLTPLNVLYGAAAYDNDRTRSEVFSTFLTIMPWYHAYGLISTINLLTVGKRLVFMSQFEPRKYLESVQKYEVNVLVAVPPIVVFIAKSPMVADYDLSTVYAVLCGSAPLSSETVAEALKRLPNCIAIRQGYGMTESSMLATVDIPEDESDIFFTKPGSGGRPVPGVKLKVVDPETRQKLGPNQEGEICLKGPVIMKGYAGNEAETRNMLDDEGYLKTGDIGYYDEQGYFTIVDRIKELIKYKGSQVAPALIEKVILQHGKVVECAVVGAPDDLAGELPTAFVVIEPGAKVTEKEILDFANAKLTKSSRLYGGVIFVKEIPKNQTGKILRRVLKKKLIEMRKSKL